MVAGHVLLVEDDETLARVMQDYLRRSGFTVTACVDGISACAAAADRAPDVAILDRMLPGMDGLAVCARLRALYPSLPVIMVTALGEEDDRISGLTAGVDDYVTKPFSPRELVLRVEAVLRRSRGSTSPAGALQTGSLHLDESGRRLTRHGRTIDLTSRECELLGFLMRRPGQTFSRDQLLQEVWGWSVGDHSTVTVHVRRLREKIEDDPARPTVIETVWGVGYRLTAQEG